MPEREQPIERQVEEQMRAVAHALEGIFNGDKTGDEREWGFCLLVFKFGQGDDHRSNYISNAVREDMLATLKEFIARAEGRHVEPRQKVKQ